MQIQALLVVLFAAVSISFCKVIEKRQAGIPAPPGVFGNNTSRPAFPGVFGNNTSSCPQAEACFDNLMKAEMDCRTQLDQIDEQEMNEFDALDRKYPGCIPEDDFGPYDEEFGPPPSYPGEGGFGQGNINNNFGQFGRKKRQIGGNGLSAQVQQLEDQIYQMLETASQQCEAIEELSGCQSLLTPCMKGRMQDEKLIEQKYMQRRLQLLPQWQQCVQQALATANTNTATNRNINQNLNNRFTGNQFGKK